MACSRFAHSAKNAARPSFLNSAAVDQIIRVAAKTTAADPILPISDDDNWFYLNSVLNDLSEQFAVGLLKKDMGGKVDAATYLLALTCEAAGEMKTRKIRAMVIHEGDLVEFAGGNAEAGIAPIYHSLVNSSIHGQ